MAQAIREWPEYKSLDCASPAIRLSEVTIMELAILAGGLVLQVCLIAYLLYLAEEWRPKMKYRLWEVKRVPHSRKR